MSNSRGKVHRPLAPLDPLQRYTVAEACAYLRISHNHIYTLIGSDGIKTIKDGKRRYVPGSEIARLSRIAAGGES